MAKLKEVSTDAFDYLCNIDNKLWTRAYSEYPRFGHDTSNIVESLNSSWDDYRRMPLLQMLDGIYLSVTKIWFERRSTTSKSDQLADVPMAKFGSRFQASRRYRVYPTNENIAQVEDPDTGRKWVVVLDQKSCDCQDFWEYQSPCSHAIAAARVLQIDSIQYFEDLYTTREYKKTYRHILLPVSIENLSSDNSIKPPVLRKGAGRPRTKRIRKGNWNKKQTRCSNCLDWGHNRRSCTGQPVSNGRRQRAFDWLQEVDNEEVDDEDEQLELDDEEQEEEAQRLDQELGIQVMEEADVVVELGEPCDSDSDDDC
jgi:hypothetical protein